MAAPQQTVFDDHRAWSTILAIPGDDDDDEATDDALGVLKGGAMVEVETADAPRPRSGAKRLHITFAAPVGEQPRRSTIGGHTGAGDDGAGGAVGRDDVDAVIGDAARAKPDQAGVGDGAVGGQDHRGRRRCQRCVVDADEAGAGDGVAVSETTLRCPLRLR